MHSAPRTWLALPRRLSVALRLGAVVCACAGWVGSAIAQTNLYWLTAGSGTWSTTSSWTSSNVPSTSSEVAIFNNAAGGTISIPNTNYNVGGIRFDSSAGTYTISRTSGTTRTLTMYSYGIVNNDDSDQTITGSSLRITLGSASTFSVNGAGDLTISTTGGTIATTATNTLTLNGNGAGLGTISSQIAGTGGTVTKSGTGTWLLSGNNSYTGGTTIAGGNLRVGSANALGTTGTVRFTGGTLQYGSGITTDYSSRIGNSTGAISIDTNGNNVTYANALANTNTGGLTKSGSGTLTLNAANNYTGTTTLNAGTLAIGNNSALSSGGLTINGGTLSASGGARSLSNAVTASGDFTIGGANDLTLSGTFNLGGGTRTITVDNTGTTTLSGVISQPWYSSLVKSGDGRLVISGSNTFTGFVQVDNGTLAITNNNSLGASGTWNNVVADGATLEFSNGITVTEGGFTVAGAGHSGAGALHNLSGDNTLNGQIAASGATTINSTAGTLTLGSYTNLNGYALTVGGAGNVTFNAQVHGDGSTVTKQGDGTLTFAGSNSYTGATNIDNGTLVAAHANALGTNAAGTTVASGATLGLQGGVSILYENISIAGTGEGGTGAIRNLSGSNTINQTVTLSNNATLASDAGTLTLNNGLTGTNRNTTFAGAGDISVTGSLATGSGTLTKDGAGTLTLNSASTFTGNTTVNAGTLNLRNNTALGAGTGTVTVGNGATLQLQNNITVSNRLLSLGGTLESVSGNNMWSGNVTLTGNASILSSTAGQLLTIGPGDFSGIVTMGSNTLTVGGDGNILINSIVGAAGNTGGFIKTGSGTVTFYGDENRYTGTTDVRDGTLVLDTLNFPMIDKTILGDLLIGDGTGAAESAKVVYGTGLADNKIANTSAITIKSDGLLDLNSRDDTVGAITLEGGRIKTGTGVLELNGNITTLASSQEATISGVVTLADAARVINVADGAATSDLTISAQLNFGGIVKQGDGRLTITSNNTVGYGGLTQIDDGIVTIKHERALGQVGAGDPTSGTVVASGAALELAPDTGSGDAAINSLDIGLEYLKISGTGYNGAETGALRSISGNNSWAGTIWLNDDARINTDAGLFTINGGITASSKNLTVGGAGDTTINGVIGTSAGTFTKDGTGTVILTGDNNYSGVSTVEAGVLNIRHNNALGSTLAGTTVDTGAQLQMQNNITVGNETLSLSGTGIGDTGALRNISGNNTWNGAITVASSSARINSDSGTLTLGNTVALGTNTLTVGGAANTTITGQLTGASTSTLAKDGAGTLTLSNSTNTFSGNVNVNAGTLAFGANNSLNNSAIDLNVASGATVDLVSYAQSVGTIAGAGMIDFNTGGELSLAATSTWSGQFTGSGTIIVGVGVTLTLASNIYAPNVNIILAGGTLNMGDGEHVFGTLTVTGDSTLDFSGSSTFEIENLFFDSLDHTLNVVNWTDTVDYFLSRDTPGVRHEPPLNQVVFTGWTGDNTTYNVDTDKQITPVPEPSTYGAMLMGAGLAFFGYRRWRRNRRAPVAAQS